MTSTTAPNGIPLHADQKHYSNTFSVPFSTDTDCELDMSPEAYLRFWSHLWTATAVPFGLALVVSLLANLYGHDGESPLILFIILFVTIMLVFHGENNGLYRVFRFFSELFRSANWQEFNELRLENTYLKSTNLALTGSEARAQIETADTLVKHKAAIRQVVEEQRARNLESAEHQAKLDSLGDYRSLLGRVQKAEQEARDSKEEAADLRKKFKGYVEDRLKLVELEKVKKDLKEAQKDAADCRLRIEQLDREVTGEKLGRDTLFKMFQEHKCNPAPRDLEDTKNVAAGELPTTNTPNANTEPTKLSADQADKDKLLVNLKANNMIPPSSNANKLPTSDTGSNSSPDGEKPVTPIDPEDQGSTVKEKDSAQEQTGSSDGGTENGEKQRSAVPSSARPSNDGEYNPSIPQLLDGPVATQTRAPPENSEYDPLAPFIDGTYFPQPEAENTALYEAFYGEFADFNLDSTTIIRIESLSLEPTLSAEQELELEDKISGLKGKIDLDQQNWAVFFSVLYPSLRNLQQQKVENSTLKSLVEECVCRFSRFLRFDAHIPGDANNNGGDHDNGIIQGAHNKDATGPETGQRGDSANNSLVASRWAPEGVNNDQWQGSDAPPTEEVELTEEEQMAIAKRKKHTPRSRKSRPQIAEERKAETPSSTPAAQSTTVAPKPPGEAVVQSQAAPRDLLDALIGIPQNAVVTTPVVKGPKGMEARAAEEHLKYIQDIYDNLFAVISNCEKNEFPHDARKGFYPRDIKALLASLDMDSAIWEKDPKKKALFDKYYAAFIDDDNDGDENQKRPLALEDQHSLVNALYFYRYEEQTLQVQNMIVEHILKRLLSEDLINYRHHRIIYSDMYWALGELRNDEAWKETFLNNNSSILEECYRKFHDCMYGPDDPRQYVDRPQEQ